MKPVRNMSWYIVDPHLLLLTIAATIFIECFVVWIYWRNVEEKKLSAILMVVILGNLISGFLGFIFGLWSWLL
jgi:uncharacterized membrane-anchored protein YitT (DUF2179 family)